MYFRPFNCLYYQILVLSLLLNFNFIGKISQNYTHLRCLLDTKVLTKQAKAADTLVAYYSEEHYILYLKGH